MRLRSGLDCPRFSRRGDDLGERKFRCFASSPHSRTASGCHRGYASASLAFYSGVPKDRDLAAVYDAAYNRYALAPNPEGTHGYAAFGHLTGYGASYYTYQWSKALASDLLSEFRKHGLRDQVTAMRYRNLILAPGGSASMNQLARNFLGRDWTVDAYRAELQSGR
ncbi:M3 family metallopeptidase [Sphingopyxis sp. DBS4]|jgi:thimet oligopeptidase|uniref:M3 family metallopeptidase n=1 Tax=Sphingopyxis sp. DBS4 TaxID=2968500 RepID=UPI00214B6D1C|nr:M3 family metallopeptidase [Sphingopyxis sp. DBS4]